MYPEPLEAGRVWRTKLFRTDSADENTLKRNETLKVAF